MHQHICPSVFSICGCICIYAAIAFDFILSSIFQRERKKKRKERRPIKLLIMRKQASRWGLRDRTEQWKHFKPLWLNLHFYLLLIVTRTTVSIISSIRHDRTILHTRCGISSSHSTSSSGSSCGSPCLIVTDCKYSIVEKPWQFQIMFSREICDGRAVLQAVGHFRRGRGGWSGGVIRAGGADDEGTVDCGVSLLLVLHHSGCSVAPSVVCVWVFLWLPPHGTEQYDRGHQHV